MYRRHRDRSLFMCTSDGSTSFLCAAWFYFVFIHSACCLLRQSCVSPSQAAAFDWFAPAPIGNVYIAHLTTISSLCFWLLAMQFFFSRAFRFYSYTFVTLFWVCRPYFAVKNKKKTCEEHESKWWWNIEHSWSAWINRWKLLSNQFTPIK